MSRKDFPIHERVKLNFRFEWHNVTNTPWFSDLLTTSVTSPAFGSLNLVQDNSAKTATLGLRLLW